MTEKYYGLDKTELEAFLTERLGASVEVPVPNPCVHSKLIGLANKFKQLSYAFIYSDDAEHKHLKAFIIPGTLGLDSYMRDDQTVKEDEILRELFREGFSESELEAAAKK